MGTHLRWALGAALLLTAFTPAGMPASAHAQGGESSVQVRVLAGDTQRPLSGAHVVVRGTGAGGLTDVNGIARIAALPPGSQTIEVRYLGYRPQTALVALTADRVAMVSFELRVQPIELAEIRVRPRRSVLRTVGFYDRKNSGFGAFVTRDEITQMQPRYLSDVLRRIAGIHLTTSAFGSTARASIRGVKVLGACPIQYYVDGTMTTGFNIDEVTPSDVEGLEIYRGASTIPPAFNKGTAMCGVIVIWTRVQ